MAVTEADRLAAAGVELVIVGRTFHVKYPPRSLKLLEDRYGSVTKVGQLLEEVRSGAAPLYSTTYSILSLGLRHETDGLGQPITEDWLLDNSESREVIHYANAAFAALVEALPGHPAEENGADPTTPPSGANPSPSNGVTTSGSLSGTSISVQQSSGTE